MGPCLRIANGPERKQSELSAYVYELGLTLAHAVPLFLQGGRTPSRFVNVDSNCDIVSIPR